MCSFRFYPELFIGIAVCYMHAHLDFRVFVKTILKNNISVKCLPCAYLEYNFVCVTVVVVVY